MKHIILIASLSMAAQLATAASITFNNGSSVTGQTFDLTALGTSDWAYWNSSITTATSSIAATNEMSGGSGIGSITGAGTTTDVRGTTSGSSVVDADFSFTNGTSTGSGTASNVKGVFNSDLNTVGAGVELGFTLAEAGQAYTINVWTSGYATERATITGSIAGATAYDSGLIGGTADSGDYGGGLPKESYRYTFTVIADSDDDVFSFNIITGGVQGSNSHAIITAATIAVPEPSAYALLAGCLALGAVMVRRRK